MKAFRAPDVEISGCSGLSMPSPTRVIGHGISLNVVASPVSCVLLTHCAKALSSGIVVTWSNEGAPCWIHKDITSFPKPDYLTIETCWEDLCLMRESVIWKADDDTRHEVESWI